VNEELVGHHRKHAGHRQEKPSRPLAGGGTLRSRRGRGPHGRAFSGISRARRDGGGRKHTRAAGWATRLPVLRPPHRRVCKSSRGTRRPGRTGRHNSRKRGGLTRGRAACRMVDAMNLKSPTLKNLSARSRAWRATHRRPAGVCEAPAASSERIAGSSVGYSGGNYHETQNKVTG